MAAGLVGAVSVTMAATGWGTGDGPLGPPGGGEVGVTRDVGARFTEGLVILHNDGWFDAHIESVRPIPLGPADDGLTVEDVSLARVVSDHGPIGIVDGLGEGLVPTSERRKPAGVVIPQDRSSGRDSTHLEVLATYRITHPGTWTYRGYEVTYRSGLVRHRMVVPLSVVACAPKRATPGCSAGSS